MLLTKTTLSPNRIMEWRRYNNEPIVESFRKEDWMRIFVDIDTDEELRTFLTIGRSEGYVAYDCLTTKPFAFICLLKERCSDERVFVHGGGWSGPPMLKYESIITMCSALFQKGKKIRTQCLRDNVNAFRFLHSIGFVNHFSSNRCHYFWLPYKRFVNTAIYKRINKNN